VTNTGELPDESGIIDRSLTELLWHADYEFTEFGPIQAISLYGHEVPESGCPTMFANNVEAVKKLPRDLRERVSDLKTFKAKEHTGPGEGYDDFGDRRNRVSTPSMEGTLFHGSEHDVIETHPLTGESWLTVSQMMTSHVVGWTDEQSDALFTQLDRIAYDPSNIYEHDWHVGDLVVWDNIALRHRRGLAPKGLPGGRRVLRRAAVDPIDMLTRFPVGRPAESLVLPDVTN
jgi:taurine dioxygenase